MISVTEAKKILLENLEKGEAISAKLGECLGAVMAEDIYSPIDVPSFNNSAMDGYAMKFKGKTNKWKVVTTIQAGDTSAKELKTGEAARIFTGAKIPEGADTVIPQEQVEYDEGSQSVFYDQVKIETGSNVRLKGSQCEKGDLVLEKGTIINPGAVGLLASVGIARVRIYRPPGVAYVITGDELKEVGSSLQEGEIYNSNGPMLEALLKQTGIKDISAHKAADDKEKLQQIINSALEKYDVLILSGGISVGDYDFVKECLETAGVKQLFYKLKQRPGKPFFAGKKGSKWVFALPGNPASVHSCFVQYVRPCLRAQMGQQQTFSPDHVLPLSGDAKKKPGFTFFMKGKKSEGRVQLLNGQQSFNLQAFATADCLVELPEESDFLGTGSNVNVYDL